MRLPLLLSLAAAPAAAAPPPDVIFLLADDLGYNELNFMNNTRGIKTPNLDELAYGGVTLHNYYVQPICSPTRSALMTGRYTTRLGTHGNVIFWDTPWGVPIEETFIPNNMKDAGYKTAMFGKWHLGMFKQDYMPASRGFDQYIGYLQGCGSHYTHVASCCTAGSPDHDQNFTCPAPRGGGEDFRGYDWFRGNSSDPSAANINSCTLIKEEAVRFLNDMEGDAAPFFLYLPFQNVHGPHTCDEKYFKLYDGMGLNLDTQTLWGYISEMDDAIGEVFSTLKKVGRYENSVIIFSSDNGAPPDAGADEVADPTSADYIQRNYPFRGWKTQIWEGGTRVAGFIHSPLLPEAVRGTKSWELFHVTDWLPTIVALAGGETKRNKPLDGHDIWGSISKAAPSPRKEVFYNVNPLDGGQAGRPKAALRVGDMKVLSYGYSIKGIAGGTVTGPIAAPAGTTGVDPAFIKGPVLFNLTADPTESNNLANNADYKAVLEKLLERLEELAVEMVEPMQWDPPYQGEDYFCKDCPKHPAGTDPTEPWLPWL